MTAAELCSEQIDFAASQEADCLYRAVGFLDGPHHSKGPGEEWGLDSREGPGEVDFVGVSAMGTHRLNGLRDEQVAGLFWHGKLVAFAPSTPGRPDTGDLIRTEDWGTTGWLLLAYSSLFSAALSVMIGATARAKAVRDGGWWRSGDPLPMSQIGRGLPMYAAQLLFIPACFAMLTLLVGVEDWVSGLVFASLLVLVAIAVARQVRTARPQEGAGTPDHR